MEDDARRVSDELRHKHIRTLEVLRQLVNENNALRKQLKHTNRMSAAATESHGENLEDRKREQELQAAIKAGETANREVGRVTAELTQALAEAEKSRAAEEANELTLVVILARNKELEESRGAAEKKCREQAERFEADILQLQERLASTIAEGQEAEARARLDVSRLESEVEELRHNTSQAALSRSVGTAWSEAGDDESVLSQREVEDLQLCVRKASRRESTVKRRCIELERQVKTEARRREVAERQLRALQSTTSTPGSLAVRPGSQLEAECPSEGTSGFQVVAPAAEPLPVSELPTPSCGGGNISDDGSTSSLGRGGSSKKKRAEKLNDEERLGSGIRRLRGTEKILRESNAKLQRELKQNAKRLEKAESFASNLEAELQHVAGDGVNFETFVVLRRENQALKTQLAELKQAYSMVLSSSPSRKVNISFSDPSLRDSNRSSHSRLHFAGRGGWQRGRFSSSSPKPPLMVTPSSSASEQQQQEDSKQSRPPFTSPTQQRVRSLSSACLGRGRTAPLRAVCLYKRAASMGAVGKEQE